MKKRMMLLVVLMGSCLYGSVTAHAVTLTNEITPGYVEIASVEASLKPAEGMIQSTRFDGFEVPERNIEVVMALIRSPFDGIVQNFTKDTLKTRGVDVKSRTEITINGRRGLLVKALHPDAQVNWGKWILLLENGDATLVVNGVFVSGDNDAAMQVESMLKGVIAHGERQTTVSPDTKPSNEEVAH